MYYLYTLYVYIYIQSMGGEIIITIIAQISNNINP